MFSGQTSPIGLGLPLSLQTVLQITFQIFETNIVFGSCPAASGLGRISYCAAVSMFNVIFLEGRGRQDLPEYRRKCAQIAKVATRIAAIKRLFVASRWRHRFPGKVARPGNCSQPSTVCPSIALKVLSILSSSL